MRREHKLTEEMKRVEYIESTGAQYILPNYTISSSSIIEIDFQLTERSSQNRIIGSSSGYFEIYLSGELKFSFSSGGRTVNSSIYSDLNRHILKIDNVLQRGYIDTNYVTIRQNTSEYFGTNCLLARYPYLAETRTCGKLFGCKIKENNTTVRQLVPVRIGNVGYLYDEINNDLYGNNGEGNFIIGPDL